MRGRACFPLVAAVALLVASGVGADAPAQTSGSAVVSVPGDTAVPLPPEPVAPPTDPTAPALATSTSGPATSSPATNSPATNSPATSSAATTTTPPVRRTVVITGNGFGHGRGLGQWGAYGYAVDKGWDYRKILGHYYSNTEMGKVAPQSAIGVRLMAMDAKPLTVFQEKGRLFVSLDGQPFVPPPGAAPAPVITVAPAAGPVGVVVIGGPPTTTAPTTTAPPPRPDAPAAMRIRLVGSDTFVISDAPSCVGPWLDRPPVKAVSALVSPGPVDPQAPEGDPAQLLQLCGSGSARKLYRGDLLTTDGRPGGQRTVNQVSLEEYLRSVVPAEVPRSWGSTPKGMEALKAQAVAARSYAAAEKRSGFANTCDTISCQVYKGRGELRGSELTSYEDLRTDLAVKATAGEIRVEPGTGVPARTEFSSSTGGYTAPGVNPPVLDDGDATVNNPHRGWTLRYDASRLEGSKGRLTGIETKRDGFGPYGGRVLEVRLRFAKGSSVITGGDAMHRFGLRSTLYDIALLEEAPGAPVPDAPDPLSDQDPTVVVVALAADDDADAATAAAGTRPRVAAKTGATTTSGPPTTASKPKTSKKPNTTQPAVTPVKPTTKS